MNKQLFNILPKTVKNIKMTETKNNVIEYICNFNYKVADKNAWLIFFPEKYDIEPDGLFWSKPKFTFKPIFPVNKTFKALNLRISLSPTKNTLNVISHNKVIFTTDVYNQHIDITLPYSDKYEFETNPYIPPMDDRELGIYISKISIVELNDSVSILNYSNLTSYDISDIKCVNYE